MTRKDVFLLSQTYGAENHILAVPLATMAILSGDHQQDLIMSSMVVRYSHTDEDIDRTIEAVAEVLFVYRLALDDGIEKY